LHVACDRGFVECVRVLLQHGADINAQVFARHRVCCCLGSRLVELVIQVCCACVSLCVVVRVVSVCVRGRIPRERIRHCCTP
jgi:hypothetical protein